MASRTPRAKERDSRDFDTTALHSLHAKTLNRDYSAHFWRWSFARRMIKPTDHVLEVGCGVAQPLTDILFHGPGPRAASYTGVDINPLKQRGGQHCKIIGEFNFANDWKRLPKLAERSAWDVVVHLEVIEHMKVEHGKKLLKGAFELLRPGGMMIMSTPVYDGKRHAANHIHEYTVGELEALTWKAGFKVERRFGTFLDVKHIGKALPVVMPDELNEKSMRDAIQAVRHALGRYYDNDALSCFFAPFYPDHARNNLWMCRKPQR